MSEENKLIPGKLYRTVTDLWLQIAKPIKPGTILMFLECKPSRSVRDSEIFSYSTTWLMEGCDTKVLLVFPVDDYYDKSFDFDKFFRKIEEGEGVI